MLHEPGLSGLFSLYQLFLYRLFKAGKLYITRHVYIFFVHIPLEQSFIALVHDSPDIPVLFPFSSIIVSERAFRPI